MLGGMRHETEHGRRKARAADAAGVDQALPRGPTHLLERAIDAGQRAAQPDFGLTRRIGHESSVFDRARASSSRCGCRPGTEDPCAVKLILRRAAGLRVQLDERTPQLVAPTPTCLHLARLIRTRV